MATEHNQLKAIRPANPIMLSCTLIREFHEHATFLADTNS